jgi:hypothetical protein
MAVFKVVMIAHVPVVTEESTSGWMDRLDARENDPCRHGS